MTLRKRTVVPDYIRRGLRQGLGVALSVGIANGLKRLPPVVHKHCAAAGMYRLPLH